MTRKQGRMITRDDQAALELGDAIARELKLPSSKQSRPAMIRKQRRPTLTGPVLKGSAALQGLDPIARGLKLTPLKR